jgi:hypothetical protein
MPERMRVDDVHADALPEILDDLPDALTRPDIRRTFSQRRTLRLSREPTAIRVADGQVQELQPMHLSVGNGATPAAAMSTEDALVLRPGDSSRLFRVLRGQTPACIG